MAADTITVKLTRLEADNLWTLADMAADDFDDVRGAMSRTAYNAGQRGKDKLAQARHG